METFQGKKNMFHIKHNVDKLDALILTLIYIMTKLLMTSLHRSQRTAMLVCQFAQTFS